MNEQEKNEIYDELLKHTFMKSFEDVENIKKQITILNEINKINMYDMNEKLSEEKMNEKQNLKEYKIMLPLTSTMKEFLKYIIISYNGNIENIKDIEVKYALENATNQSTIKENLNNISIFINYIQKNIDSNFLEILTRLYFSRRKGYHVSKQIENQYAQNILEEQEKLKVTTEEFKNAFVDIKNLLNTNDEFKNTDLTKLMDYTESIRDASLYLILRKKYISLLDDKETFYNNQTFNEIMTNLCLNDNIINIFQYLDGQNLLNNLNRSFEEYFEQLFIYCDEVADRISSISGQTITEPNEYVKKHFEQLFEKTNIKDLEKLSPIERIKKSTEIKKKKESLLDKYIECEDELNEWIENLNQTYTPEYLSDYKLGELTLFKR